MLIQSNVYTKTVLTRIQNINNFKIRIELIINDSLNPLSSQDGTELFFVWQMTAVEKGNILA